MNNKIIKKLTATLIVSAAILGFDPEPLFAQGQAGQTSPHATSNHNKDQKGNVSFDRKADNSMSHTFTDEFVEKASQSNLAEIELSKLLIEKGSTKMVREYAQMMIDHHTKAQVELYSIVSDLASSDASRGNDANDEREIESTNNDADKTATLGGTGGTTGNAMAQGKTNGEFNSNRSGTATDNTASDAGSTDTARPGTNPESNSSGTNTNTTPDTRMPGTNAGVGTNTSSTESMSSGNTLMENGALPTQLSAEHKELLNKLSILSGAELDREYVQAMVKDHAKAIELFEKQALQSKNPALQSYASKMLPIIKDHYRKAQELSK